MTKEQNLFNGQIKYKIKATGEVVSFSWLMKVVAVNQDRLKLLSEIGELTDFFFQETLKYEKQLLNWKDLKESDILNSLEISEKILSHLEEKEWNKEKIEELLMAEANKQKDRGALLWPLRVALSGQKASAGPFDIAYILGKEKTLKRIKEAIEILV